VNADKATGLCHILGKARPVFLPRILAVKSCLVFRPISLLVTLTLIAVTACSAGGAQGTSGKAGSDGSRTEKLNSRRVWIDPASDPFNEATPTYKPLKVDIAGDGTYELRNMTWQTWNSSEAIGTGMAYIDDCNPYCDNGGWYKIPVRAVFSHSVSQCIASKNQGGPASGSARYWWSQVNLTYPKGLPAALSGPNKPRGLWKFEDVKTWAQQSCEG